MSARHLPVDVVQDNGGHQQEVEQTAGGHDARGGGGHIGSQSSSHFGLCVIGETVLCGTSGKEEIMNTTASTNIG